MISNQLKEDVNKVFNYYEVSKQEAIEKIEWIEANEYEASVSFSIIAAGIRGLNEKK